MGWTAVRAGGEGVKHRKSEGLWIGRSMECCNTECKLGLGMSEDWKLGRRKLRVWLGAGGGRQGIQGKLCGRKWSRIGATDTQGTRTYSLCNGEVEDW